MPWQDNSGSNGSNGGGSGGRGGNRGPWGQPPRGGNNGGPGKSGGEPPDLEELLQASRQRLKRAFPQGGRRGGGGKGPQLNARTGGLVFVGLALLWGMSGIYQVDADELGVVTTFGKYSAITTPGLHWHAPAPIQNARMEKVLEVKEIPIPEGIRRSGLSEGLMLTGDKNIVDVAFTVQWRIKSDPNPAEGGNLPGVAQYMFNIDEPRNLVLTIGESAIREVVGRNELDFVQTEGRNTVQEETQLLMQEALDLYKSGIEIMAVNLAPTEPPTAEVNAAFLDVEAAKQDREQYVNTARAYANQIVPKARGEAQQILENAAGYAAQVTAEARGKADRFDAILTEYKKAPVVTRQRMYLETVEDVLGGMDKIIIEDDAGSGVVPYLPLNELNRSGGDQ